MNHTETNQNSTLGKDFLYSVLNLHKAASQTEINERHRALSLIFHPDKQQDEDAKVVATKRFLEIQKAYQVLSDPFLRVVYDELGERGLTMKWPEEIRSKSREEIQEILKYRQWELTEENRKKSILPTGRLNLNIDASSLFEINDVSSEDSWASQIQHRLNNVRLLTCELRHTVQKRINDKTQLSFKTRVDRQGRVGRNHFLGTIRHQFSPRLAFETSCSILHPNILGMGATYRDGENTVAIRTSCAPAATHSFYPSLTVAISRKLFRKSFEQGTVTLHAGRQPQLSISFVSPSPFELGVTRSPLHQNNEQSISSPPSISGLRFGTTSKSCGLVLAAGNSQIVADWGISFTELALQLKAGVDLGFSGLSYVFSGSWSNDTSEIAAAAILYPGGVTLKLDLMYLDQRLSLPIILSQDYDVPVAFWTVAVPSTALLLGYQFIVKPRRRLQRLAHIRAARRALDDDSGLRREREAVAFLLKETARKHMQAETSKGGLVVLEATYGPAEPEDEAKDLMINVTIPVQALVRNSQIFVPGHQPKAGIQGFSDPAPFASKSLRVRYLFRNRMHYAEIPDYLPAVLPLSDHLVEKCL